MSTHPEPGPLPAVDDHLVTPETPYEMVDGELIYVPPANEPHATAQATLASLLTAHVADGYRVAVELLTRTSVDTDIAPDASVLSEARDPHTGGRLLEELAFEVVSTQTLRRAFDKTSRLVKRGVRRVFAVDLPRGRVLEWTPEGWAPRVGVIEDPLFVIPIRVIDLLTFTRNDAALLRALRARHGGALEADLAASRALGQAEGRATAILDLLSHRGVEVPAAAAARIRHQMDATVLDGWFQRAVHISEIEQLWPEDPQG